MLSEAYKPCEVMNWTGERLVYMYTRAPTHIQGSQGDSIKKTLVFSSLRLKFSLSFWRRKGKDGSDCQRG